MSELKIGDYVLYNTHQLVAFNKPPTLPVQPDPSGDASLLDLGRRYCQTTLLPINRIDRPVSGVVLFAKKASAAQHLNEQFQQRQVAKLYLAVVTRPEEPLVEREVQHYLLKQAGKNRSLITDDPASGGQLASLRLRPLADSDRYLLVGVQLITGRHHQIRAQLAHLGLPVRGDVKYGFRRRNPDRSIDLHAWRLRFRHPVEDGWEELIAPPPATPLWQAFDLDQVDLQGFWPPD